jgi:hypothetical protein
MYGGSLGSAGMYAATNSNNLGGTGYSGSAYISAPQYNSQANAVGGVGYDYNNSGGVMGAGSYGRYGMSGDVGMCGGSSNVSTPYGTGMGSNMTYPLTNQQGMMGGVSSMDVDSSPYGSSGGLKGTGPTAASGYNNFGTSGGIVSTQHSQVYGGGLGLTGASTAASTPVNSYNTSYLSTNNGMYSGGNSVDDNSDLVENTFNNKRGVNHYSSPYY